MSGSNTGWDPADWVRRHELLYTIQMNRLYYHKRERFFALMDRGGKALSLIFGTAAASSILPTPEAKAFAGAVVAAATMPGLVFAWADKSRLHAELAADYARLEAEVVAAGVMDAASIDAIFAKSIQLGTKEPAGLSALIRLCQNEMAVAAGQLDKVYPLSWYERWFVHLFDFPRQHLG